MLWANSGGDAWELRLEREAGTRVYCLPGKMLSKEFENVGRKRLQLQLQLQLHQFAFMQLQE